MKSLLEWCVRDMEAIARVASRDSGKTRESASILRTPSNDSGPKAARKGVLMTSYSLPVVDAAFGEVLTTCEKLRWTIANGEEQLKSEPRS